MGSARVPPSIHEPYRTIKPLRKSAPLAGKRAPLDSSIQAEPGLSFVNLLSSHNLVTGEAQNHLRRLEVAGLVQSIKLGRFRRYFPHGMLAVAKKHIAALRTPVLGDVYRLILARPGLALNELGRHFAFTDQAIRHHARTLERLGLIRRQARGRCTEHWPAFNGGL